MYYRRFRVQAILRVAVIGALALGGGYLVARGWYVGAALSAFVALLVGAGLVRYVERWARDLNHFLEAIRYEDFSQGFSGDGRGSPFVQLAESFNAIMDEFRRVRAEREEHARYLQNVIHHVGVALVSYRAAGQVEMTNNAAKRLLRRNRLRHVEELVGEEAALGRALLEMESGTRRMVQVAREDRTLQLAVYVTRFRLGEQAYALASMQDIGDELAEKEMEAWQQLTRVLTHEIMNSVAPIASLAETAHDLLEENGEAPHRQATGDVREALGTIRRRGDALVDFVESYRTFTKIPAPTFEMIRAADLLGDIERLLRAQAARQGVRLRTEVDPPGLMLTVDPRLMEQVLINLVLNALQAVDGQEEATVVLRARTGRSGHATLQVEDDGPGIPADVQERIFVPFFTTKAEGSGIGLSLARQIVRLHGGTLGVRSAPGEGATFTMRL